MYSSQLVDLLTNSFGIIDQKLHILPGYSLLVGYIKRSYQNDPYRSLFELALFTFGVIYVLRKEKRIADRIELNEKEIDQIIEEWQPESLVSTLVDTRSFPSSNSTPFHSHSSPFTSSKRIISVTSSLPSSNSINGNMNVSVSNPLYSSLMENGKSNDGYGDGDNDHSSSSLMATIATTSYKLNPNLENRSSLDFLSLQNDPSIKNSAIEAVRECGVGTCGPCGFYGTQISHIELESLLSKTLNTEASIIYSQGFSSISSVIPAFSKKGDIIVADELVNTAIYKGMTISRSHLYFYKHNDMNDLKRVLEEIQKNDLCLKKPLTRRFIVSEGVFQKSGDVSPLPQLIQIKTKYKYRLILDESIALGTIGKRGLGSADYWNCQNRDVDIILGVLNMALGSSGGFCAGSEAIVDHQRLSSQAYCFSASLPVLFAKAAMNSIERLAKNGIELMSRLHGNLETFKAHFKDNEKFKILSMDTPYMLLQPQDSLPSSSSSSLLLERKGEKEKEKETNRENRIINSANNLLSSSPSHRNEQYQQLHKITREMGKHGYQLMILPTIEHEERIVNKPSIRICLDIEQNEDQVIKFAQALNKVINSL